MDFEGDGNPKENVAAFGSWQKILEGLSHRESVLSHWIYMSLYGSRKEAPTSKLDRGVKVLFVTKHGKTYQYYCLGYN